MKIKIKHLVLCFLMNIALNLNAQINVKTNCATNSRPAVIKIISKEEMAVTGSFNITLNIKALGALYIDSLRIGSNSFFTISANNSLAKSQLAQTPYFGITYLDSNQTTTCNLAISHPTSNLPYFPEDFDLDVRCHTIDGRVFYSHTNVRIYFTPYNSVEIWDISDFMKLPRVWAIKQGTTPVRTFIPRTAIPVSTRPSASAITQEWQTHFQDTKVDGLPYLIEMAAVHPDTIRAFKIRDSLECIAGRGGLNKKTLFGTDFKGQVKGKIKTKYINDNGKTVDLFLSGIKIIAKDEDLTYDDELGTTHTDENGYFEINYNNWQSDLEGSTIEMYVKLYSENDIYDLDVISDTDFDDWFNISYKSHFWIGDVDDNENTNMGERNLEGINDAPFKILHFASNAYRFSRANLNTGDPDDGLNIFLYNGENTSYFQPRTFAYHPYISLQSGDENHESVVYHEFGHFLMFCLQDYSWASNASAKHTLGQAVHPSLAWTEGWASGIGAIFDTYYRWQDKESGVYAFYYGGFGDPNYINRLDMEPRFEYTHAGSSSSGFKSEYFIATVINDLFDGPTTFPNYTYNFNSSFYDDKTSFLSNGGTNYQAGQKDDLSLSFQTICSPLTDVKIWSGFLIEDIWYYYYKLHNYANLCDAKKISKVFVQNGITRVVNSYNVLTDHMSYDIIRTQINVDGKSIYLDVPVLDGVNNSFNVASDINSNDPIKLTDDITVRNGAKLYLWGNTGKYFAYQNQSPPSNYNSTKNVEAYSNSIAMEPTSVINIGGVNPVNFTLKCGSELKLMNTSNLIINSGSTLTVESGAKLIYENGANVDLNSATSKIIVKPGGQIILGSNATFNYRGAGTIIFETAIGNNVPYVATTGSSTPTARFMLNSGNFGNKTKKLLQVTGGQTANIDPSLYLFAVLNGNIALDANSRINVITKCQMQNVDIVASTPNSMANRHRGIIFNGFSENIYNVSVSDATTGITALNFYGGGDIYLSQFSATRCGTALQISGKGANVYSANITNCDLGVFLDKMDRQTYFYNPTITACKRGMYGSENNLKT